MILSDRDILQEIERKTILIEPFKRECLGTNSYDVHLSKHLATYDRKDQPLDARYDTPLTRFTIHEEGLVLMPGKLYLGSTIEYTETLQHVPFLEGKSSSGRLGIFIHATAGKGDVGFCNYWTLEISVLEPVRVYEGMPIGQLIYHTVQGTPERLYHEKPNAKYTRVNPLPQQSQMFRNDF